LLQLLTDSVPPADPYDAGNQLILL
jgi:hypothetical protein